MSLISSISGTRGTIGGSPGQNLTPPDIVQFAAAYGAWLSLRSGAKRVVIGRDARPSGEMVQALVANTLIGMGFEVIDLGLSTTPTVEMAVVFTESQGGIVITASHNPVEWNALKLLNHRGEFVTRKDGLEIMDILENKLYQFADVRGLGQVRQAPDMAAQHLKAILNLPLTDAFAIGKANFKVVVDGVNSSGGIFVPQLLRLLGLNQIVELNCHPTGWFTHNPEPLEENLQELCAAVRREGADLGIAVDPDVDRLVLVDEQGNMFGEEYTLVAVADYVLQHTRSAVVSNLSSSRALADVAERYGCRYYASAVGEVNVIEIMKRCDALIGGEGNGGIIYPALHYGRDALVGIALFLSHLAKSGLRCSELRASYPSYFMAKKKITLPEGVELEGLLAHVRNLYAEEKINDTDGVRIDFENSWVHLRGSNTEPIVRVYAEAPSRQAADVLADRIIDAAAAYRG